MAALNFPSNPVDGQIYPDPPQPGVQQYQYNATKGTWLTVFRGVDSVTGTLPIFIDGSATSPNVNIRPATITSAGSLSAADKAKLDLIPAVPGTVSSVRAGTGLGAPATGDAITTAGTMDLLPATTVTIGGVKPGTGTQVDTFGTISIRPPSTGVIGGVKQGRNITIDPDGTINATGGGGGGGYAVLDSIQGQFNGTTTVFTLKVGGVLVNPPTNSLMIFLGGVIQVPGESFTVTGSQITFTGAPAPGTVFYGVILGSVSSSSEVVQLTGYKVLDNLTPEFNGSLETFQMTVNGVPVNPPISSLMLFLGGVLQVPGMSFFTNGSTLTFTGAPPATTTFYGVSLE